MDDDLTDRERYFLFHAAAGRSFVLKYACPKCAVEIFTANPVEVVCKKCQQQYVGRDIV